MEKEQEQWWDNPDVLSLVSVPNASPMRVEMLLRYLWNKWEIIVNDEERKGIGWRVASAQIEKWNDLCVAQRCKRRGMTWSLDGVTPIAYETVKIKHSNY